MQPRFMPYAGNTGELRTSENHVNFRWLDNNCHILFSMTVQGKAVVCHFTSNKAGLRKLKQAINEWCEFCFWLLDDCKMIIGIIEKASVFRLAKNCGFKCVASFDDKRICIKEK